MTATELKNLLYQQKVLPTELAKMLKCSRSTVWRWLNCKVAISHKDKIAIKSVLMEKVK